MWTLLKIGRKPVPTFRLGRVVAGVYVDNGSLLGTAVDVKSAGSSVARKAKEWGLPLTWTSAEPLSILDSVGLEYHFEKRKLRNKARRIWRTVLAGDGLLQRKRWTGEVLRAWVGHAINQLQLTRPALTIFYHCYRFITAALGRRLEPWPALRAEIRDIQALLLISEVSLDLPFCREVVVGGLVGCRLRSPLDAGNGSGIG